MAGLRHSHTLCIRAAFSASRAGFRRRRTHCFKASHRKNRTDFVEGIWREFLGPFDDDSEDILGYSDYSVGSCSRVTCNVTSQTAGSKSQEGVTLEDSPLWGHAGSLIQAAPEALDVDMQPVSDQRLPTGLSSPEVGGWAASLPESQDWRMTEDRAPAAPFCRHIEPLGPGRPGESRAKGSWPAPRLSLFKRKLELLLAEPENSKRKKQYVT